VIVEGDTNGRWGTMVTISPGPRIWAQQVRWGWTWRRELSRVKQRLVPGLEKPKDVRNLTKLSMIGFARWSMIDRIPTGVEKQQATPLPRPFLLFETNFNGDRDAYFEAFSYVVPNPMNRVWDKAYKVPDVKRVSEWQRVINQRRLPIAYYYSAYPDASTKMIRGALELERMLAEFRPLAANLTAQRFDAEFRALLGRVARIQNPDLPKRKDQTGSLTTMIPVDRRRRKHLKKSLKSLEEPPRPLPTTTHFARWCVVEQLEMPPRFGVDPTSYLLFTGWFDGVPEDYAAALYQQLGPDRAKSIWGNCGFDGDSAEEFAIHLMRYRVPSNTAFLGYNGVKVDEVRAAVSLCDRFGRFARDTQGLRGPDLQTAWVNDPVLSRET
jgi:hypothetical protein